MKGGVLMNILIVGILVLLTILIVYLFTCKSDIYANKIKINIFKLVNIEINNKVKCSEQTDTSSEHLKKHQ